MSQAQPRRIPRKGEAPQQQKPVRGVALPADMRASEALVTDEDDEVQGEENGHDKEEPQGEPEAEDTGEQVAAAPRGQFAAVPNPHAVEAAKQRALEEGFMGSKANQQGAPSSRLSRRIAQRAPMVDATKLTKAEAVTMLNQLLAQQQRGFAVAKAIRWNNGAEPNIQNGQLVSARDKGGISVYGFSRNPVTLYAGQWLALAQYMPDVLRFIDEHREEINEYVEQRLGNKSKEVSEDEVEAALNLFCIGQAT